MTQLIEEIAQKTTEQLPALQIFKNEEFGSIRTIIIDNEPWFVAKDVCDILGIQNPTDALNKQLEDFERTRFNLGRQGEANIISESGFYTLVLRSRKPIAKPFLLWVNSEVLPQIRKTGGNENKSVMSKDEQCDAEPSEEINTTMSIINEISISGTQEFMGREIPVILGGFGKDKKCMSDKTVAEIHGMEIKHIRELVTRNIKRFKNEIDYIDLKVVVPNDHNLMTSLGYSKMQISKSQHIYLFSERGYAKLIKIMDTDEAWDVHDQIMDEYFVLREKSREMKLAEGMLAANAVIEEQRERIRELEETEKDWKTLMDTTGTFSINQLSQFINIGEYHLFEYLRKLKVLWKNENNDNVPYRQHLSSGKFAVVPAVAPNGVVHSQTRVYPEGIPYITKLLRKNGYLA